MRLALVALFLVACGSAPGPLPLDGFDAETSYDASSPVPDAAADSGCTYYLTDQGEHPSCSEHFGTSMDQCPGNTASCDGPCACWIAISWPDGSEQCVVRHAHKNSC
jgi:hypothetical protein